MNCPRCGSEMQLSDPVCPRCGTRNEAYMPAQPEQQPYDQQYQQPYNQQPYQQYQQPVYYAQPPKQSNGMAIAGFILSFLFPLLGLIFSIIGSSKAKQMDGAGQGLATAGIVISVAFMLLGGIVAAAGMSYY